MLSEDEEEDNISSDATSLADSYYDSNTSSQLYKHISWLDNAKIRYGGRFDDNLVDDVKSLKKIILLFAILVPYWIVYFQIETTFIIQGLHMRLLSESKNGFSTNFMLPAAWLSIADQITVLIMIPVLDSFVYPYIRKKSKNVFCENTRLVLGMGLSACSVIIAGFLETFRLNSILDDPVKNTYIQIIDNTTYYASNMHITWQIPQYTLIGLGEVFCTVACLYYAYSAAPKSMQSIIMGLFYFFSGLGSFVGSIILLLFKKFIYSATTVDNINCKNCYLNYYFYFLALLQILGMIAFILIDYKYSIAKTKQPNEDLRNNNNNNNNLNASTSNNLSSNSGSNNLQASIRRNNYLRNNQISSYQSVDNSVQA